MTIKINGGRPGMADDGKPLTFDEADDLDAFKLAALWADLPRFPLGSVATRPLHK